jgi:hypothetical protein
MSERPQTQVRIKLLSVAFLIWGLLSIAVNVPRWRIDSWSGGTQHNFVLDFGSLGVVAALGLWRHSSAGRKFALVLTWYWLFGAVALFFRVFPIAYLTVTPTTDFLANVPKSVLRAFVLPFFLVQLWQLYTLRRPDVIALFTRPARKPKNSCL